MDASILLADRVNSLTKPMHVLAHYRRAIVTVGIAILTL